MMQIAEDRRVERTSQIIERNLHGLPSGQFRAVQFLMSLDLAMFWRYESEPVLIGKLPTSERTLSG